MELSSDNVTIILSNIIATHNINWIIIKMSTKIALKHTDITLALHFVQKDICIA